MTNAEIVTAVSSTTGQVAQAGFDIFGGVVSAIAPYAIGIGLVVGIVYWVMRRFGGR